MAPISGFRLGYAVLVAVLIAGCSDDDDEGSGGSADAGSAGSAGTIETGTGASSSSSGGSAGIGETGTGGFSSSSGGRSATGGRSTESGGSAGSTETGTGASSSMTGGSAGSAEAGAGGSGGATGGDAGAAGSPSTPSSCDDGCLIGAVCYPDGVWNPKNPCERCDAASDAKAWSDNDGAICDDGEFCTVDDVCSSGSCEGTARDCSDGVDCNGTEHCDETANACVAGTTTCPAGRLCDHASDRCVASCPGCAIGGVCYGDGQVNPLNPCQKCDAEASASAWRNNDGAACDDGEFCTGADTCSGGSCSDSAGDPCEDDGLFCNGAESCSEAADACVSAGNPCTDADELCDETANSCYVPGEPVSEPSCNDDGNVVQYDARGVEILVEDCVDAPNGTCDDGVCGCAEGLTGDQCESCLLFVDGSLLDYADHDGSTWELAYRTVQGGLDAAAAAVADPETNFKSCEVWVASGTYLPTDKTDSLDARSATIELRTNVALYGGFAGDESSRSERDTVANKTVLSGDLELDDNVSSENVSNNAYHVVTGADRATIDGFTITAGNADGTGADQANGGGMLNVSFSPAVTDCIFSENSASSVGGGMYNSSSSPALRDCTFDGNSAALGGGIANSSSSPTLTDCVFSENSAEYGGGMHNSSSSEPTLNHCTFSNNTAESNGAGMDNTFSSPTLTDCTFSTNSATVYGGGMHNESSSPTLTSCTFDGNSADYGGGVSNTDSSLPELTSCIFSANSAKVGGGGGIFNYSSSPTLTNCSFSDNSAETSGGAVGNASSSSPAITNCTFFGNNAVTAGGAVGNSSSSSPAITNCTFSGNSANFGGGIAAEESAPTVMNSILWGDTATASDAEEVFDDDAPPSPTVTYSIVEGGYTGAGNINQDPLFAPGAGNLQLQSGSPAIDQGTDGCPSAVVPLTDKDGNGRWDISSIANATQDMHGVDIGAYEFQGGSADDEVTALCP